MVAPETKSGKYSAPGKSAEFFDEAPREAGMTDNEERFEIPTLPIYAFSIVSFLLFLANLKFHAIKTEDLALLVLAGLPWVFPYLKTIKLPGGVELQLKDIRQKVAEVAEGTKRAEATTKATQLAVTQGIGKDEPMVPRLGYGRATFAAESSPETEPEDVTSSDPNKGKFGGKAESNGRRLTARVTSVSGNSELFLIQAQVTGSETAPLQDGTRVSFHLHPTFHHSIVQVDVKNNKAALERVAWGAFTIGVKIEGESTSLELDLAELADAPALFRSR